MRIFIKLIIILLIFITSICAIYTYAFYIDKNKVYMVKVNYNAQHENNIKINKEKIIAHRGVYFKETENSLDAIKNSINHKVCYAEIDVQSTKDGIVVLMHDKSLKRLTGLNKTVYQLNYDEIRKLNIGSHYFSRFRQKKIPTLNEVIKECNGKIKLIVDIKPYGDTKSLTQQVVSIIKKNNFENQCMIHSLSYNILSDVKRLNSNIETGYVIYNPLQLSDLTKFDVDFYSINQNMVTKSLVIQIHESNKKVYVWKVDNKDCMNKVINLNVDGVIADKLSTLIDIKKILYIKS